MDLEWKREVDKKYKPDEWIRKKNLCACTIFFNVCGGEKNWIKNLSNRGMAVKYIVVEDCCKHCKSFSAKNTKFIKKKKLPFS